MTRLYVAPRGQLALFPGAKPAPVDYANRGRAFEEALEEMHALYANRGLAEITKNYVRSTVIKGGRLARIDGPAIVDYSGTLAGGRAAAFDAKDCAGRAIPLDRLRPHQAEYLGRVFALGGLAFVLVRFEYAHVYRIPISSWADAVQAHAYGPHAEYVGEFKPTGKASIRMEELPAAWRVTDYDWLGGIERAAD